jgi:hypothetical protein
MVFLQFRKLLPNPKLHDLMELFLEKKNHLLEKLLRIKIAPKTLFEENDNEN